MERMILVLLILQGLLFFHNRPALAKRRGRIEGRLVLQEIQNCPGHNIPNQYVNNTLVNAGKGYIFANAEWIIKEPADAVSGVISTKKCTSPLKTECEHFMKVDVTDLCKTFVEKGQLWTTLYGAIKPEFKCPVHEGVYVQRNGTLDTGSLAEYLPMVPFAENYYWRFMFLMFREPDKKEFFCLSGAAVLKKMRVYN